MSLTERLKSINNTLIINKKDPDYIPLDDKIRMIIHDLIKTRDKTLEYIINEILKRELLDEMTISRIIMMKLPSILYMPDPDIYRILKNIPICNQDNKHAQDTYLEDDYDHQSKVIYNLIIRNKRDIAIQLFRTGNYDFQNFLNYILPLYLSTREKAIIEFIMYAIDEIHDLDYVIKSNTLIEKIRVHQHVNDLENKLFEMLTP